MTEFDPRFTPDGLPWDQQDETFWMYVRYVKQLYEWAEWRVKHPLPKLPANAVSMDQL